MPEETIEWLLVAESPPCPKDFDKAPYIYRIADPYERRNILEALVDAFKKESGDTRIFLQKEDKLKYLKNEKLAFLMDLCLYPINKMDDAYRDEQRKESEKGFSRRLRDLSDVHHCQIRNILIVGSHWHDNCLAAVDSAGMGDLVRNRRTIIPFPAPGRPPSSKQTNRETCVDRLSSFFADPLHEERRNTGHLDRTS